MAESCAPQGPDEAYYLLDSLSEIEPPGGGRGKTVYLSILGKQITEKKEEVKFRFSLTNAPCALITF